MTRVFDFIVGLSNIVAAGLALLAIFFALGIGTVKWQRYNLTRLRWRTIGKTLRLNQPTLSRTEFAKSASELLDSRIRKGTASTVQEMHWLTELAGAIEQERVEQYRMNVRVPFTYHLINSGRGSHQERLHRLADSYREYGAAVRRRWMLRAAAAPLITDEYECSRAMSRLIDSYARLRQVTTTNSAQILGGVKVQLSEALDGSEQWVRLAARPDLELYRKSPCFADVKVSYAPYRVLTSKKSIAYRTLPLGTKPLYVEDPNSPDSTSPNEFDGIMTRLHGGSSYRVEMDPHSGRQQLHLCLSETSFFAFRLTQWNELDPLTARPLKAFQSRLLSVNLLLVDDFENVLLVRRAAAISHGGRFAGAASGACEVVDRDGIKADIDANGLPDPMATVRREAREELGIDLSKPERKLGAIGLIEVMSPRDMRTHVLTATARLSGNAKDFYVQPGTTDDIEGTWELGGDAMVIELRTVLSSATALHEFVKWLRTSDEMLPHGVGGLILLLAIKLEVSSTQDDEPRATLDDLAQAVSEPLGSDIHARPSFVSLQPLIIP